MKAFRLISREQKAMQAWLVQAPKIRSQQNKESLFLSPFLETSPKTKIDRSLLRQGALHKLCMPVKGFLLKPEELFQRLPLPAEWPNNLLSLMRPLE